MTAQDLYARLLSYKDESRRTGNYWYGLSNYTAEIHHRGDDSTWYTIYIDGMVTKHVLGEAAISFCSIGILKGDDFEFFNSIQIFKAGYVVFKNAKTKHDIKRYITELYQYIDAFNPETIYTPLPDDYEYPYICGTSVWENGMTDKFEFYTKNDVELKINMIDDLIRTNIQRKYYGLRCLPFKKYMKAGNSIYVTFINDIENTQNDDIYKRCNMAVKELMGYFTDLNMEAKWYNCNCKNPLYA